MTSALPKNWEEWLLGDTGEWLGGGTPSSSNAAYWNGGIPWVSPKDMKVAVITSTEDTITRDAIGNSAAKLIPARSVLFVTRSGILAHSFPVATTRQPVTVNQDLKAITPIEVIDPDYLAWVLRARTRQVLYSCSKHGTTVHSIEVPSLKAMAVPIAPAGEQPRIVAKIEGLFAELDTGGKAVAKARAQLKAHRQSVLKAAVTGALTHEWRRKRKGKLKSKDELLQRIETNRREAWEKSELDKMKAKGVDPADEGWKQRYKEPTLPDTRDLAELPEGWAWGSVEAAGEVRLGRQRAPQHHRGLHMRPYLRVANVLEDRLDLADVMEMNFTPQEFESYALRSGDILLNEGQSPELVGRPAMYRGEIPGCCYQKTLLRFRAYGGIRPEFALLVFRHYLHSGRFRASANITTSIGHLAAERFVAIEFPVPSEEEQIEIVATAANQLSLADHLKCELELCDMRVAALRESVLKEAFSGTFVAQDPEDEPVSVQLARLRAEREVAAPAKQRARNTRKNGKKKAA